MKWQLVRQGSNVSLVNTISLEKQLQWSAPANPPQMPAYPQPLGVGGASGSSGAVQELKAP